MATPRSRRSGLVRERIWSPGVPIGSTTPIAAAMPTTMAALATVMSSIFAASHGQASAMALPIAAIDPPSGAIAMAPITVAAEFCDSPSVAMPPDRASMIPNGTYQRGLLSSMTVRRTAARSLPLIW